MRAGGRQARRPATTMVTWTGQVTGAAGRAEPCGGSPRPRTRPPWPEPARRRRGSRGDRLAGGTAGGRPVRKSPWCCSRLFTTLPLGPAVGQPGRGRGGGLRGVRAVAHSLSRADRRRPGRAAGAVVPAWPARVTGCWPRCWPLPFLVLALADPAAARDRIPAVLLAALAPVAAWAGCRGGPAARPREHRPPGRSSPARWSSTRPGANAPGSPANCTTLSPTTSP